MNHDLHNLKQEAQKIVLTPAEKSAMRARIFAAPAPLDLARGKPSPYVQFSFSIFHARVLVPLSLVLVVLVGSGTAYAARGALPGDVLYPVKISVNENVETALATSASAKAQVHAKLAQARVEEAETLAARGTLDATTTAELAANFESHAQSAEVLATDAEEQEQGAGTQIKTELDSNLSAHGAILAALSDASTSTVNKEKSGKLAVRVLAQAGASARVAVLPRHPAVATKIRALAVPSVSSGPASDSAQNQASDRVEAQAQAPDQKVTAQLEEKAADALAEARKNFDEVKDKLDATTTAQVAAQFANADKLMSVGSEALAAGSTLEAAADFTKVLQISIRLSAVLEAQQKFDSNVITPVLKLNLGGESDEH